jgi:membrane-associated phospholipid phosphatase
MYAASRTHAPLCDRLLADLDRRMGIEVPAVLSAMAVHPHLRAYLSFSYDLLFPLMVAAVVLPALRFHFTAAKEYIVATSFATLAGAGFLAGLPAVGPWVVYGFAPSATQAQTQNLLLNLHALRPHVIQMAESGIICFPSFHVVLSILSVAALFSIRHIRIPAFIVGGSIALSTLTTGWHYMVDVAGGIALAVLSVAVAKTFTRVEAAVRGSAPISEEGRSHVARDLPKAA